MGVLLGLMGILVSVALGYGAWQETHNQNQINNEIANTQNTLAQETFDWNKEQASNTFEYNKWLNELQMQREDTAVQRRMEDLKAAGLSPLLAAGDAAASGAGGQLSAPSVNAPDLQGVNWAGNSFESMMGMTQDVYKSALQGYDVYMQSQRANADLGLISSQTDKYRLENEAQKLTNSYLEQQLIDKQTQNYVKIDSMIADLQLKIDNLEKNGWSLLLEQYKAQKTYYERLKAQYEANMFKHDWNIIDGSVLPSDVIKKGAQSGSMQFLQDTQVLDTYNENIRNTQIPDMPNVYQKTYVNPDGYVVHGSWENTDYTPHDEKFAYGGLSYAVSPDGTIYYGHGFKVKDEFKDKFIQMMESEQVNRIPLEMLIQIGNEREHINSINR